MTTAATINSIVEDFNRHIRYAFEYRENMKPITACYHDGVLEGMIMVLSELGRDDPKAAALVDTLWKIRADKEQAEKEFLS